MKDGGLDAGADDVVPARQARDARRDAVDQVGGGAVAEVVGADGVDPRVAAQRDGDDDRLACGVGGGGME